MRLCECTCKSCVQCACSLHTVVDVVVIVGDKRADLHFGFLHTHKDINYTQMHLATRCLLHIPRFVISRFVLSNTQNQPIKTGTNGGNQETQNLSSRSKGRGAF